MPRKSRKGDPYVRQLERALAERYKPRHPRAKVTVYRYNSASIRVRVIDPDFAGRTIPEREDDLWEVLDTLPEEVRSQVSMLLLLTPAESKTSMLSMEFDNPTPSKL